MKSAPTGPAADPQVAVLLVDDDARKRAALLAVLAPLGHDVIEADSGTAALRALMARDFAVILMDVQMPTMNGYETADLIRQRQASEHTPIIFVTAYGADEVSVTDGYAKGAVDFIFAPVNPAILRAKVTAFVRLFATTEKLRDSLERATWLSEERGRLAAIVESSADAIINCDEHGVITSWNQGAEALYGYTSEEMIGSDHSRLDPSSKRWALTAQPRSEGRPDWIAPHEFQHLTKDGVPLHLSVRRTPIRDSRGVVVGTSSTSRDVSEIVQLNTTLAVHAARQSQILELFQLALEGVDFAELVAKATRVLADTTESPRGSIVALDAGTGHLATVASWGGAPILSVPYRPHPRDLSSRALRSSTPLTVEDYSKEARVSRPILKAGIVSGAAMLIGSLDHPYGIAAIHDYVPRVFSTDDLEFLQLVAHLLSLALARERAGLDRERLMARVVSAREEERNTIAADIHDDAVQVMTVAGMRLFMLVERLDDPVTRAAGEAANTSITLAIERLRSLMFRLIPPDLERIGLEAALRDQSDHLAAELGIPCTLTSAMKEEPRLGAGIAMYRVFQEAASNVRKHAGASSVHVDLAVRKAQLVMRITDDGRGFTPGEAPQRGHFGVASMRGRIEAEGGRWSIVSAPGKGTTVEARLPLRPQAQPMLAAAHMLTSG